MLLDLMGRTCRENTACFAECCIFICHNAGVQSKLGLVWHMWGRLETELAVALRGGAPQTFTTGELPSD